MTFVGKGVAVIKAQAKVLSENPGVYRMLGEDHDALYIGKAKNLKKRVASYAHPDSLPMRIQHMISLTRTMEFFVCDNEASALILEATLIKRLKPRFNVLMRDDKSFPHLLITKDHRSPQLLKHRGVQSVPGTYFGPFASTRAVNHSVDTLTKVFQLRTCSDHVFKNRSRPCLQYHLKRCSAPCVGMVSDSEYAKNVALAKDFLTGRTQHIQRVLEVCMQEESAVCHYEKAAVFRDRLRALHCVQENINHDMPLKKSVDVFAIFVADGRACIEVSFFRSGLSYGNKAYFPIYSGDIDTSDILKAFILQFYQRFPVPNTILLNQDIADQALLEHGLRELAGHDVSVRIPKRGQLVKPVAAAFHNAQLALERKFHKTVADQVNLQVIAKCFECAEEIKRIEVYDNSHLFGTSPKGAMIVAGLDGFDKTAYRQFCIRRGAGALGDDCGMMREVLSRRFQEAAPEKFPDLIILDGGKGQLNAAKKILNELDLSLKVVAMGKGPNRNAGEEWFYMENRKPFQLPKDSKELYYLQRLRDESHRFAINAHRQARRKISHASILDQVSGLGPKRKNALLYYFGSIANVKNSSVKELAKVPGIHQSIAKSVYDYFHG